MKKTLLVALSLFSAGAFAGANCVKHPQADWMPQDHAKAKIEAQGYKIRKFKVDGNCYEIYGENKDGKKAEVYFDVKTLAVVKSEIGK
jgi:hypothetical protein